jgi:hypothetical protein
MHDPANGIVCLPNYVDHDQLRVFYKVLTLPALLVSTNTDAAGGAQAAYVFVFTCFTGTKIQTLTQQEERRQPMFSCTVYLLHWYKSTNTYAARLITDRRRCRVRL